MRVRGPIRSARSPPRLRHWKLSISDLRDFAREYRRAPLPKENVLAAARYLSSARPDTLGYLNACAVERQRDATRNAKIKYEGIENTITHM